MTTTLTVRPLAAVSSTRANGARQVAETAGINPARKEIEDRVANVVGAAHSESSQLDEAEVSSTAVSFAEALKDDDDVRWEKVMELRQSIAAGTYHVSSLDIAGKMIEALSN